jgi:hypothetical protein
VTADNDCRLAAPLINTWLATEHCHVSNGTKAGGLLPLDMAGVPKFPIETQIVPTRSVDRNSNNYKLTIPLP